MDYLTIGTCWKDEHDYALDFVKYHKAVGVQKFIIFDQSDDFNKIHDMFKSDPDVETVHFPRNPQNLHADAWGKLVGMGKNRTKWLALIDADQAIVPVKTNDIKDVLKNYEEFASLQCNWHTFGSSGHAEKENGSLYERFLMRAAPGEGINNHTQFICQPDRTLAERTNDPHHPRLPSNEQSVNTNKSPVHGPFNTPSLHDIMYIAHYINKSKAEWAIKNSRGRADIFGQKMPFHLFDEQDKACNAEKEERVLDLWKMAVDVKI